MTGEKEELNEFNQALLEHFRRPYANKTDAEIIHQLTMEFNSLNRIVAKKASNWQIAYRENIRMQHELLTEFFIRKNQTQHETQS